MHNTKLIISYDGTDFYGWQRQKEFRTVQQELEEVLLKLSGGTVIRCHASGRTDTGVHAEGQVVHFHSELKLKPDKLQLALNSLLPDDMAILSVEEVPDAFDASRSAKRKMYRYVIFDHRVPDVFVRRYAWHYPQHRLDEKLMQQGAEALLGTHDFRCFETEWPNRKTSVRTITHLEVRRVDRFLWIDVEANGFLYNMVRSITGTLMNVGRGYWPASQVKEILEAGQRTMAGPTAPPQGLFLMRVTY